MSANERVRFAGMSSLVAFGATGALVMAMVFPRQSEFSALADFGGRPDAFSIAYLEALVRSSPRDARDPVLHYARSLASVGRYGEALEWLTNLPGDAEAAEMGFDVEIDYLRSLQVGEAHRDELARAIREGLAERATKSLPPDRSERLARVALERGWPSLAAAYYRRLADENDPRRAEWLREAARWYLASDDPRAAAKCYEQAATRAVDAAALEHDALAAAAAFEAAGDVTKASEVVDSFAGRLPGRAPFLRRGVVLALAAGRPDSARKLGAWLVATGQVSDEELGSQMHRELVAGDVRAALSRAEELVHRHPHDDDVRRTEARLAEQAGDDRLALRDWAWLAR